MTRLSRPGWIEFPPRRHGDPKLRYPVEILETGKDRSTIRYVEDCDVAKAGTEQSAPNHVLTDRFVRSGSHLPGEDGGHNDRDPDLGRDVNIPPIPTPTELKVMLVLLKQTKGIYARQLLELSDGAIPDKSEHKLLARLRDKGYVSATSDAQPFYTLTEAGRIIGRAFVRAFALL